MRANEDILREFDCLVEKLRNDIEYSDENGDTETHEFGYRNLNWNNLEVSTIVDWANIRKFIEKALIEKDGAFEITKSEMLWDLLDFIKQGGNLDQTNLDKLHTDFSLFEVRKLKSYKGLRDANTIPKDKVREVLDGLIPYNGNETYHTCGDRVNQNIPYTEHYSHCEYCSGIDVFISDINKAKKELGL